MKKKHTVRKILNIISTVLLIAIIAVVIFVFIARITGNVPSIFGFTVFRVQTDSMSPTLEIGDVIIDRKVPAEEIKKGDIITYDCLTGEMAGHTITHRVITEPEQRDGIYYFQTQGDKTGAIPDEVIRYDQIEGKFITKVPLLNQLYTFFLSPYGLIAFIFLIMVLFGYELISLILSYRAIDEKDDSYYAPPNKKPSKKRKK